MEINSYIRGYHVYKEIWSPTIGESLLVKRESDNVKDSTAVAIYQEDTIVGHVPKNLASRLLHFLTRDTCKAFAEVTGNRVNRGAGYGLEIPCTYCPPSYIKKWKNL